MNTRNGDVEKSIEAHEEYLAEVERLIGDEVASLFGKLRAAATGSRGMQAGADAIAVTEDERHFKATSGQHTIDFVVEAVTDLPDPGDRAREFPEGQARCTVTVDGRVVEEWALHRTSRDGITAYAWMSRDGTRPVTDDDVAAALQPLYVS